MPTATSYKLSTLEDGRVEMVLGCSICGRTAAILRAPLPVYARVFIKSYSRDIGPTLPEGTEVNCSHCIEKGARNAEGQVSKL